MDIAAAAMDLIHLMAVHDIASRQRSALDAQISDLCQRSFTSDLEGRSIHSLCLMLRVSVSEGVRQVYDQYCQRKQQEVDEMAHSIIQTLAAPDSSNSQQTTLQLPGRGQTGSSSGQMESDKAAKRWSNLDSNFYRGS